METFINTLHITLCLLLIVLVLMQPGKGADISSAFGGGAASQLFGAAGPGNFLTRGTGVIAGLFMLTSIILVLYSTPDGVDVKGGEVQEEGSGFGNSTKPADDMGGLPPLPVPAPAGDGAEIPTAIPGEAPGVAPAAPAPVAPAAPAPAVPAPAVPAPAAPAGNP